MKNIPTSFPASIDLGTLTPAMGFTLNGVAGSYSGRSVSGAGDINGDGVADLIIGAYGANSQAGASYVVFGKPGIGSTGSLPLSSLNGANGFVLPGVASSESGYSVSGAGDVNVDGVADLIIGAPYTNSQAGANYVVFGKSGIGTGSLPLLSLNGANGFVLPGVASSQSGISVSGVGDINGDGVADLIIGARSANSGAGASYVVFGKPGLGSTGSLPLSSLNGANGFVLPGVASSESGFSVSGAGDINGDGVADLIIGAYGANSQAGASYVVFGKPGIGSTGSLMLSSLNGANGFVLPGVASSWSGISVSGAGDINGDGVADLIIGAYQANSTTGASYVVFGKPGLGSTGSLTLSNLNGANGFVLPGVAANDYSGISVSGAGDINGDGVADLIIGAYYANAQAGASYVVFGKPGIGSSGSVALSSLNGSNGFVLSGVTGSWSGISVSGAGDVNGDGVADLIIGAPNTNSNAGASYVVFGDIPPVLVNNHLSLSPGSIVPLTANDLSAYDHNHKNNTLVFVPTAVSHGQFELMTQPGISLVNFTQPQLINGTVQFVHDGSSIAPSYNISVYSAGIAWTGPVAANITFLSAATTTVVTTPIVSQTPTPTMTSTPTPSSAFPVLLTNQLTLSNGQTVILSSNNLQASELGFNNSQLIFSVGNVQNGYFSTVPMGNGVKKNLTSFSQGQINSGAIEFVHNGAFQAPGYLVLVSDGMQSTLPSLATINFTDAPVITQNTFNITTSATIILTPTLLNVTATDSSTPSQVLITVSDLQHATITSTLTGTSVNNFTLAELQSGDIRLTQDGSLITPSCTVTASGIKLVSSAPSVTDVYFSNQGVYAPQLVNNYLRVTQGEATILSSRYLSAMQPSGLTLLNNSTMFYMSNIEYGHFSLVAEPKSWLSFFSQGQLDSGQIQFVQDGSSSIPGYRSAVQAFGLQSASLQAGIFFTAVNESPPSIPLVADSNYSTVQKAIIGAVISGTIGIFFAVLQGCLKRASNKKLLQALGEDTDPYDLNVVRPVAKEIAERIKITGFMNATTNKEMKSFKSAVRSLLSALDQRGVDLNFAEMKHVKKDALINEIGRQVERWVKEHRRGCTAYCPGLTAFFKPQLNPDNLADAAGEIADKIIQAQKSQQSLSARLSVSGSPVFKEEKRKFSLELDSPSLQSNLQEELHSDLSSSQLS